MASPTFDTINSDPPLNPNQPNHKINVPKVANGIFDPGIAFTLPSSYLPFLAPRSRTPANAAAAPHTVKNIIKDLIKESLYKINKDKNISIENIEVNLCKDKKFGDFSSNVAMRYSHAYDAKPKVFAEEIIKGIKEDKNILKIEVAGPGFLNFFVSKGSQFEIIETILDQEQKYGKNKIGSGVKVLIEFVSANPTGPLHVGHGRGAAFGDCLSNLLKENDYDVVKEYYVNDAGKQIDILTLSVLQRYHELIDENYKFEYQDLYKGDYVWDIAAEIHRNYGNDFFIKDLIKYTDKLVDHYILNIKNKFSDEKFKKIKDISVKFILENIKCTVYSWDITMMICSPYCEGLNYGRTSN